MPLWAVELITENQIIYARVTHFMQSSALVEPHTFLIKSSLMLSLQLLLESYGRGHGLFQNESATNFSWRNSRFMCMVWLVASCNRITVVWLQLQKILRDKLVLCPTDPTRSKDFSIVDTIPTHSLSWDL